MQVHVVHFIHSQCAYKNIPITLYYILYEIAKVAEQFAKLNCTDLPGKRTLDFKGWLT